MPRLSLLVAAPKRSALILTLVSTLARADGLTEAAIACGWGGGSPQMALLRAADAAAGPDGRPSVAELVSYGRADNHARVPDQALAAVENCVAGRSGEADPLYAPRGGHLLMVYRWAELFGFDNSRGATQWAVHLLTAADLAARGPLSRSSERFFPDMALGSASPVPDDYRNTGYDRGHLLPAGDAADEQAMRESFAMGNVVPQDRHMNERAWELLESALRDLVAATGGRAVVVTGALFLGADGKPLAAGQEARLPGGRAGIPTHIFKAFALWDSGGVASAAAYLCPNRFDGRVQEEQLAYLRECVVPIPELAQRTGLEFFPGLRVGELPRPITPARHRGKAALLWPRW